VLNQRRFFDTTIGLPVYQGLLLTEKAVLSQRGLWRQLLIIMPLGEVPWDPGGSNVVKVGLKQKVGSGRLRP
jgi:hypothetical protein